MREQLPTADSDLQIIAGLKRRDPAALGDLYDRYGRIVYLVALRKVRNSHEAEDIVQEVFLRVWTRAHLIDNVRGTLGAWLLTVTRNLAIDHIRACSRHAWLEQPCVEVIPGPVSHEFSDIVDRLSAALTNLTHEQRRVVELAYYQGLSQTEISERVGKPLGTVKTCVRGALQRLRCRFNETSSPEV
jgi:RNA polymerase sigma-70 factor (ECF subfamily)